MEKEMLDTIKNLFDLENDIDKAIERAYQSGKSNGVREYLADEIKKFKKEEE